MARNRYLDDEEEVVKLNAGLLKRLFRYMIPYKKLFFAGLFLLIINVLVTLIWPRMTQWIIDDVLSINGAYANSIKALLTVIGIVSFVLFVDVFLAAKRVILITKLGHNTIYDIRQEIFDHVQTLSFKYFDDRPAGKIMVRITNYVDSLSNLLSSQIIQLIVDVFTLLCILVILLSMNLRLTLLSFAVIIPLSLFIIFLRRIIAKWARRVRAKSSNRTAYIHENIMGTYVTQSFNREQYNHKEMIRLDDDVNYQFIRLHLSSATLGPAVDILSTIGTILVYFVAIQFIAGGEMTLGALTAFTTYMTRFWQPIASFTTIFNQFCEATSNIERIFETIDTEPEIEDRPDAYVLPDITGRVEYKNVDFSYDGKVNILENVSFTVEPGQMIAFVGPTGAGKTTVVNLLSRFYDVTGGSVEIDGHDVRNVTLQSLRTQVGVMMQDSFIFTGTIMDNIRYGRPEATDEECIAAARKVYASEFIERLPEGYNTKVQERGAGLSTGERQLLSFARAVLANPKILILDEATSSIDTQTELLIQRALAQLLEGRTSFVIAHRLSTIKRADQIMCICNKGIAERGTHEELMQKKGIYYELNMSQYRALIQQQ
jgi:ABC transporter related